MAANSKYHRAESDFHRAESVFKEQNRWGSLDLTLVEQTPTSVEQTKFSLLYFVEQNQTMVVEQNHTIPVEQTNVTQKGYAKLQAQNRYAFSISILVCYFV